MNEDSEIELEDLLGPMLVEMGNINLKNFCEENPDFEKTLKEFSPVKTAALFSGLLIYPELQSNCLRLEVLTHLAIIFGENPRNPNKKLAGSCFSKMDETICGGYEDPAEDVFVSLVSTPKGNFRTFEGLLESNSFFLQRFLNIIETMPESGFYNEIRRNVYALLKLGDEIAKRSKVQRYSLGNQIPLKNIPSKVLNRISSARKRVSFSEKELNQIGVSQDDLWGFIFDPNDRKHLLTETIGHTALERRPVVLEGDQLYIMLPTSIGGAIRRYVIEKMMQAGMSETFEGLLALEYAEFFSKTPILGLSGNLDLKFQKTDSGLLGGVIRKIDKGRFLNLVFIVDGLKGFDDGGLIGVNPDDPKVGKNLQSYLKFASKQIKDDPEFCSALTLIISCGWGRSIALPIPKSGSEDWRVEACSAADLGTLSWVRDFKPLSLMRILETRDLLKKHNVILENVNGLLNLVAWSKSQKEHLVPHGHLPDSFASDSTQGIIFIDQNGLRNLRHEVSVRWDAHYTPNENGVLKAVRKEGQSYFKEDDEIPIYASEDDLSDGKLKSVYEANLRPWWCEISVSDGTPGPVTYEYWKMLTIWLQRAAPVLDKYFGNFIEGPVLWLVHFEGLHYLTDAGDSLVEASSLDDLVSVSIIKNKNTVRLDVGPDFEKGFSLIENVAERILVEKLINGIYQLSERPFNQAELEEIINLIIPDSKARLIHRIHANAFRDRVKPFLPRVPITVDRADDAGLRIGLGWKNRPKNSGPEILGKEECLKYLNLTVEGLENDLCLKLKKFNKTTFLKFFLENYEISTWESEHWRRTSGAVLSLHQDKPATYKALAEKEFLLNGASLASRLLIEMGNCECDPENGREPGELEASRLMSQALIIAHLGGLSDGIRWDAVEPRLKITALGDIHFNVEFFDDVMVPFAEKTNFERLKEEKQRYPKNFKPLEIRKSVEDAFENDFIKAWEAEHKSTLDEMRLFLDCIEDHAIVTETPVYEILLSDLLKLKSNGKGPPLEKVTEIIESLKSTPRPSWKKVPKGFLDKDRQPWRFRRRLSVIRKPLIQINDSDDPTFLISPGLIRDGFIYNLINFFQGSFPPQQAKSQRMKSWIGKANHKHRIIFNTKVAEKMIELGWQAKSDINVTEILNKSTGDKNFGDVDVIAWDPGSKRVLMIECKDVQFRKTPGEIAEQISDFRGNIKEDGKPDLLKKHIDRIDYLKKHQANVATYVGFSEKPIIEGHIVFKNPVPMKFAWSHLQEKVNLSIFNELNPTFKLD